MTIPYDRELHTRIPKAREMLINTQLTIVDISKSDKTGIIAFGYDFAIKTLSKADCPKHHPMFSQLPEKRETLLFSITVQSNKSAAIHDSLGQFPVFVTKDLAQVIEAHATNRKE
jgi:hypothetical protein